MTLTLLQEKESDETDFPDVMTTLRNFFTNNLLQTVVNFTLRRFYQEANSLN